MTEMRQFIDQEDAQKAVPVVQQPIHQQQPVYQQQPGAPPQYAPVQGVTQGVPQPGYVVPGQPVYYVT